MMMTPDFAADKIRSWFLNSSSILDIEYEKKGVELVINAYLATGQGFMCADFQCKIPQCSLCIDEVGPKDGVSAPHLVQQWSSTVGDSEIEALRKLTLPNTNMSLLEFLQEGAAINDGETAEQVIEVIQFLRRSHVTRRDVNKGKGQVRKRCHARKKNVVEVGQQPFKCPRCIDFFDSKGEFMRHHRKKHGLKFPCNRCKFNATSREMIKAHPKDVHKGKTSKH